MTGENLKGLLDLDAPTVPPFLEIFFFFFFFGLRGLSVWMHLFSNVIFCLILVSSLRAFAALLADSSLKNY